jgi:hypothetical protein
MGRGFSVARKGPVGYIKNVLGAFPEPLPEKGRWLMIDSARLLQEQMKLAESQADSWKPDHEDARDCYVLEYLLRMWLRLAEDIEENDNKIRLRVLQGEAETKAEVVAADIYRHWFQAATRTLVPFRDRMEGKGYQVERAAEFRNVYREL